MTDGLPWPFVVETTDSILLTPQVFNCLIVSKLFSWRMKLGSGIV
jgi:hypothetical protein